jgi:hypothetical protein
VTRATPDMVACSFPWDLKPHSTSHRFEQLALPAGWPLCDPFFTICLDFVKQHCFCEESNVDMDRKFLPLMYTMYWII